MTKQLNFLALLALFIVTNLYGQPARTIGGREVVLDDNANNSSYITTLLGGVGINQVNALPHPCALLDLSSTTKGFLVPRMGSVAIAALCGGAPPEALIVYNTATHNLNIWNGTMFMSPWQTAGNTGTNPAIDYLGTGDAIDLVIRTNNIERMRFTGNPLPNTSAAPLLAISNPVANQQGVRLNGTANGVIGNTLAGNPGVWDLVVNGDAVVSGLFKLGASIWVDGFTPNNHAILADDDLTIGTNAPGQNLTLTAGPGGVINVNAPLVLPAFPLDVTVNNATFAIRGTQNGTGKGIVVQMPNAGSNGRGIEVTHAGVGTGVFSTSAGSHGVWGITGTISGAGILGDNTYGEAVVGRNRGGIGVGAVVGRNDSSGYGVRGFNTANGIGVLGQTGVAGGQGKAGRFENVNALNNQTTLEVETNGIGRGISVNLPNAGSNGRGIEVTHAGVGTGVFSTSAGSHGVWGITGTISGAGILGDNTYGEAVVGRNRGGIGVGAVVGRNDSSGYGVRGFNTANGIGVLGQAGISGGTGVGGRFENVNASNTSTTLQVQTNGTGSGISVQLPNAANGARGIDVSHAGVGPGVFSTSAGGNALWGITSSISAAGVIGDNTYGEAVVGRNRGGVGVGAVVGRNDSSGYGVRGFNTEDGIGVLGQAGISGGTGVGGRFENVNAANTSDALQVVTNSAGNAARFTGNVVINGNLNVSGTVAKGGGSFMIDHPLDPENKILYHSFVESPDMKNIHDGVVQLDGQGEAWVDLPNWFQAVNGDFRYQLTAIGAPGPQLYIAQEIKDNRFRIAGGTSGMKVSWMVTGIRHDAWAQKHRIKVEVDKNAQQKGQYLHPEAYGQTVAAPTFSITSQSLYSATPVASAPRATEVPAPTNKEVAPQLSSGSALDVIKQEAPQKAFPAPATSLSSDQGTTSQEAVGTKQKSAK